MYICYNLHFYSLGFLVGNSINILPNLPINRLSEMVNMKCPICNQEGIKEGETQLTKHYRCSHCDLVFNAYPVCDLCDGDIVNKECESCGNKTYHYETN